MRTWLLYIFLIAAIVICLFARFNETFPGDVSLIKWSQDQHSPVITDLMEAFTFIGSSWIVFSLAILLAGSMFILRRYRKGFVSTGVIIVMLLSPVLKLMIDRPRPPVDLVGIVNQHHQNLGFPSGHTFQAVMLFGFLIFIASVIVKRTWLRRTVQILLGLLILAISISRIYLGEHWPSDVLGSYVIGGFFLTLLIWLYYKKNLPGRFSRKK